MQQGAAGCSRVQKVAHKDWERDGVRDWAKAGGLGAVASRVRWWLNAKR